ncbi:hypothetical protein B5807_04009 [Epicoccum nigrum]|uniref:Uncharacterized protein n=1 Tax=Epicoccum nigrum TaxID=105696 RepID=A0A1Y2M875_EPING|nr:hypothetical protein B5807_04009 [Epicoccum nigrum]
MSSPSSELRYHQYLPTKYVRSPSSLVEAVRERAGEGNFQIEMRHNMYCISLNEQIGVLDLLPSDFFRYR